jgi:hypothetical protein
MIPASVHAATTKPAHRHWRANVEESDHDAFADASVQCHVEGKGQHLPIPFEASDLFALWRRDRSQVRPVDRNIARFPEHDGQNRLVLQARFLA